MKVVVNDVSHSLQLTGKIITTASRGWQKLICIMYKYAQSTFLLVHVHYVKHECVVVNFIMHYLNSDSYALCEL
jgi:hypothetical protein